jgi:hypothetical protein
MTKEVPLCLNDEIPFLLRHIVAREIVKTRGFERGQN